MELEQIEFRSRGAVSPLLSSPFCFVGGVGGGE